MLKHDYPDASEIRRMIAEGQFHRTLQIEAIPPLVEVRSHQRGPVLILERAAGHLLPTILEVGRLNTPRF
ncbi:MAG TPA: hypothetical protein PLB73_01120, partial [Leptospiraceae bacterium]|nr:hypothetical protein [Leptospiraceae bacterium]